MLSSFTIIIVASGILRQGSSPPANIDNTFVESDACFRRHPDSLSHDLNGRASAGNRIEHATGCAYRFDNCVADFGSLK